MIKDERRILIVAGEASGDQHAAKLVRSLREAAPETNFEFFGATGSHLREAGVETIVASDDFSIVGLPEIARALPMFWRAFRILKTEAVRRNADAVILVDFPEFNLKLAKSLKRSGVKVIYYISPQLWAWRKYRVRTIEKHVDLLLTILPFEKKWYEQRGISHVRFVGSPTVSEIHSKLPKTEFCRKHNLDAAKPIIALLPGSRHKEISRILPVMLETAHEMTRKNNEIQFVIALASTRNLAEVETAKSKINLNFKDEIGAKRSSDSPKIIVVQNETHEALNAADAAAVASGTATLETAIIGTPLAVVYKTSAFNYKLLRPLISVEHFGLINLIAEERLARELIQDDFTPEVLAEELFRLLEPETNRAMRERLQKTTEKLGRGGASKRAAEIIVNYLETKDSK
jgi:lipid-A-disaccharide synthase